MSTQLIKPNYLVILLTTQHHSFFRNVPPLFEKQTRIREAKKKVLQNELHCRAHKLYLPEGRRAWQLPYTEFPCKCFERLRTTDMCKSRLWTQMCTPMANHKASLRCRRDQRWTNFVNKFNNGGVNTNDALSTQDCLNLF